MESGEVDCTMWQTGSGCCNAGRSVSLLNLLEARSCRRTADMEWSRPHRRRRGSSRRRRPGRGEKTAAAFSPNDAPSPGQSVPSLDSKPFELLVSHWHMTLSQKQKWFLHGFMDAVQEVNVLSLSWRGECKHPPLNREAHRVVIRVYSNFLLVDLCV